MCVTQREPTGFWEMTAKFKFLLRHVCDDMHTSGALLYTLDDDDDDVSFHSSKSRADFGTTQRRRCVMSVCTKAQWWDFLSKGVECLELMTQFAKQSTMSVSHDTKENERR
jgi:hypothetical protein